MFYFPHFAEAALPDYVVVDEAVFGELVLVGESEVVLRVFEEVVDLEGGAGFAQAYGAFAMAGVGGIAGDVPAGGFWAFVLGFLLAVVLVYEVFDI